MSSKYLIYGLIDPRTQELRYIGMSKKGYRRIREHAEPANVKYRRPLYFWIQKLKTLGLKYEHVILEEQETHDGLYESEQWHIAYFRSLGCRLLNLADGGPGNYGFKHSKQSVLANSRRQGGAFVQDQFGTIYDTIAHAARSLGLTRSRVSEVLSGKYKQTRGYAFTRISTAAVSSPTH